MTAAPVPAGGVLAFETTTRVQASSGAVSNTLLVSSSGDPVSANNLATASVALGVPEAANGTFIVLRSDPGDYIGQGKQYAYSQANAVMSITSSGGRMSLSVRGDEYWNADFQLPTGLPRLQPGTYTGLGSAPSIGPSGGLSWYGEGRGCSTRTATLTIDRATYQGDQLVAVDLRFEQLCEGQAAALRGQVRWFADDTTQPPGPVAPVPAQLWRAPAAAVPAIGNYLYLHSEQGDFIGAGKTYTYTLADAAMSVGATGNRLTLNVHGDERWSADFQAMLNVPQLQVGWYPSLRRYPFHNPAAGGISFGGEGRGCNLLAGWFAIDSITWAAGTLAAVELRFEQRCEGIGAPLRGQLRWIAGETTQPPGPVMPPPAGLWNPSPAVTPSAGNYVFLQSDPGDYIGAGQTVLYTAPSTAITVRGSGSLASVEVGDIFGWRGNFAGMSSISQLQPGYYGRLQRWPFYNPARGGLDWSGMGRGCNRLGGWFVVDHVAYEAGQLTALELRFEQHCEEGAPALRGKVRWAR